MVLSISPDRAGGNLFAGPTGLFASSLFFPEHCAGEKQARNGQGQSRRFRSTLEVKKQVAQVNRCADRERADSSERPQ
jgi:hypothetical protein